MDNTVPKIEGRSFHKSKEILEIHLQGKESSVVPNPTHQQDKRKFKWRNIA